jgi:hypothetical protein
LVVICIDFRDRAHISISHVVSPAVVGVYFRPSDVFIGPRGMGFIDRTELVFWCMDSNVAVRTPSTLQPVKETVGFFFLEIYLPSSPSVVSL